jgi:nucleotide-binding universal stress UspA family protein
MDVGSDEVKRLKAEQREKGLNVLSNLKELAGKKGVKIEAIIRDGDVYKEIIKISTERNVDLIIMGTHGRRGFAKLIDPNTLEESKKECPSCPFMILV